MTNIVTRSFVVFSLVLTGIVLPLHGSMNQDTPPAPEITQAASDGSMAFLPLLARNPFERIITPTPPPTSTPPFPSPTPPQPTATPRVPTATPGGPTPTLPPLGDTIIVDHTSIALFDRIPEQYLAAARSLRMMFSDRSVGQNINEALDCLAASSWASSPSACRRDYLNPNTVEWKTYTQADLLAGNVPALIQFPADSTRYNRSNWDFEFRMGEWSSLTEEFITSLAPQYLGSKDVLTYQFSYLNVDEASDIADPNIGFFASSARYDMQDLETFFAQHPDKIFFLWTTSLARGIGTNVSTQFNDQVRRYAIEHEKVLFDVADILSHDRNGQPCYDNRDGVQYCDANGNCENHPNDGQHLLAICRDYTTEVDGGHLGSVSGGKIQIAKAFWVLMARIAGWNP